MAPGEGALDVIDASSALPGAAAFIGTVTGGVATWVVARRKTSGRIRTSEAEVLWTASESIRHDLTAIAKAQAEEIAALKLELVSVNQQMVACREATANLSAELAALRGRLDR